MAEPHRGCRGVRVVFATYDDEPPQGGQGVYVRGLRSALQRRGVEVHTVAGRGAHASAFARVVRRPPLDFSVALNRNPSLLLRHAPDVVHAQGGPGGVLLLRRLRVPVVYTAHHTYRQAYPSALAPRRALEPLERRSYALARAVLAVSPSTADAVRAMGIARVEVVPPGIDVERLSRHGDALRDPGLILFVGRLEPEKGPLDAVAAMTHVTSRRARTRGIVAGHGSLLPQVRAAAARAGGTVEVRGAVGDDELLDLYARAAVVLMPSRYEGLGMVALEAIAAGAVVVGYDVTGLRDAVAGGGGVLTNSDALSLAAATVHLLDAASRRDDLAERGRAWVTAHHSWDAAASRVEDVYRSVLA